MHHIRLLFANNGKAVHGQNWPFSPRYIHIKFPAPLGKKVHRMHLPTQVGAQSSRLPYLGGQVTMATNRSVVSDYKLESVLEQLSHHYYSKSRLVEDSPLLLYFTCMKASFIVFQPPYTKFGSVHIFYDLILR